MFRRMLAAFSFLAFVSPLAGADLEKVNLTDDFVADSRKDYQTTGDVGWEKGRLTLAANAVLRRKVALGATAELRVVVHVPPGKGDTDVTFRLQGGNHWAEGSFLVQSGKVILINREKVEEKV